MPFYVPPGEFAMQVGGKSGTGLFTNLDAAGSRRRRCGTRGRRRRRRRPLPQAAFGLISMVAMPLCMYRLTPGRRAEEEGRARRRRRRRRSRRRSRRPGEGGDAIVARAVAEARGEEPGEEQEPRVGEEDACSPGDAARASASLPEDQVSGGARAPAPSRRYFHHLSIATNRTKDKENGRRRTGGNQFSA